MIKETYVKEIDSISKTGKGCILSNLSAIKCLKVKTKFTSHLYYCFDNNEVIKFRDKIF